MEYVKAKTIVTNSKNHFWFGADYNMNIYRGCSHGCIYCDSRSECYRVENFDEVKAKEDALKIIRNDLSRKRKVGVVATGSMSDPYNPHEKKHNLTRNALELINAYGFGSAIATKSDLILRDIDVLSDIKKHSPVIAKISITTYDDELGRKIEPYTSLSSARFKAIEKLSENGIYAGILFMPLLPFINDTEDNIKNIVDKAYDSGAKFIYPGLGVTLRTNQRAYFYEKVEELFGKDIKEKYIKRYGNRYSCGVPGAKKLSDIFIERCVKYGIKYKMNDIIKGYKGNYHNPQLSFLEDFK